MPLDMQDDSFILVSSRPGSGGLEGGQNCRSKVFEKAQCLSESLPAYRNWTLASKPAKPEEFAALGEESRRPYSGLEDWRRPSLYSIKISPRIGVGSHPSSLAQIGGIFLEVFAKFDSKLPLVAGLPNFAKPRIPCSYSLGLPPTPPLGLDTNLVPSQLKGVAKC